MSAGLDAFNALARGETLPREALLALLDLAVEHATGADESLVRAVYEQAAAAIRDARAELDWVRSALFLEDDESTLAGAARIATRLARATSAGHLANLEAVERAAMALHEAEVNDANGSRYWNDLSLALQESQRARGKPWPPSDPCAGGCGVTVAPPATVCGPCSTDWGPR